MIKYFKSRLDAKIRSEAGKRLRAEGFFPINESKSSDVYVIGFPKSGHTWMQYILSSLVFGVSPELLRDTIAQEFVPDMHTSKYFKRYFESAYFKSHDLPKEKYKKVIYLVRDGRDAMVSYYHMLKKVNKFNVTLKEMIVDEKNLFPCSWSAHVKSWLIDNPYMADLIVVKYEDLLNTPVQELSRISKFLGLERSEAFCQNIIANTQIDILRTKAQQYGLVHQMLSGNDGSQFFRQGKAKSYLKEMDPELIVEFEKKASEELRFLGYGN